MGIDATAMTGGHAIRGIGRYVDGVCRAIREAAPDWGTEALGFLLTKDQPMPPVAARAWRTRRAAFRPQDLDPWIAAVADRVAVRSDRPRRWHHTDPRIPFSPLDERRTAVTIYDLIPLAEPRVMAAMRPHRRLLYRRYLDLATRARAVIAISEATAAEVERRLGVPRSRIHVVPPLVAPFERDAAIPDVPDGRLRLLFVGIADPHKRATLAVEVLRELLRRGRDAQLTVVGEPRDEVHDALRRLGGASGDDRVRFVGRIDDTALAALYRTSILLATSAIEGFGLPPVEAILNGGRVVAASIEAYRETISEAGVFASRDDAPGMADAVEVAMGTPVDPGARARLVDRYGASSVAARLREAHEALLAA